MPNNDTHNEELNELEAGTGEENPGSALIEETPKGKKKKRIKTGPSLFIRLFSIGAIVFLMAVLGLFLWGINYSKNFMAPEEVSRELLVTIPEGATVAQIGEVLEKSGAIRSADAFVWTVRLKSKITRKAIVLKAGEMALDPSLPVWGIVTLIAKGNYKLYPFTIPEGRNIYEIAAAIEQNSLGSKADFLALCQDKTFIQSLGLNEKSLEGYLFPDTYNFPKGTSLKIIAKTMVERFFKVWETYKGKAGVKGLDRHQVVTLASIVEKETGAPEERPLIAGVFFNRLEKGMRLETDPTVIYGLLPDKFSGNITRSNLQDPNPYNTYVNFGLPPGPIANPGEEALSAVLSPARVDYLFFVSKNDGTHHFSKSLKEHNQMVNKYQRGQ